MKKYRYFCYYIYNILAASPGKKTVFFREIHPGCFIHHGGTQGVGRVDCVTVKFGGTESWMREKMVCTLGQKCRDKGRVPARLPPDQE